MLAHVGQRETPAGYQVGKRMAAAGVKRALCVKQELRNNALDQRCAGFARGMRAGGATRAATSCSTSPNRDIAAPKLRAELAARKADGVLTLSSDAAKTSLEAKKEGGRATRAKLATFDLSPEILEAVKDGRMLFAVDQQAYLQGYMPIVMLTQQIRYGLFPSHGADRVHRAELRHEGERRARAADERARAALAAAARGGLQRRVLPAGVDLVEVRPGRDDLVDAVEQRRRRARPPRRRAGTRAAPACAAR